MPRELPSIDELKRFFNYDPHTGIVTWAVAKGHMMVGQRAGGISGSKRYWSRSIKINGTLIREHHVIWAIQTGEWPPEGFVIDHKNRDSLGNQFDNLRLATPAQNNANSKARSDRGQGTKGVRPNRNGRRWEARIRSQRKLIYIGTFDRKEEADAAYIAKAKELHGEFARAS